jgi:hypothetical protein
MDKLFMLAVVYTANDGDLSVDDYAALFADEECESGPPYYPASPFSGKERETGMPCIDCAKTFEDKRRAIRTISHDITDFSPSPPCPCVYRKEKKRKAETATASPKKKVNKTAYVLRNRTVY